MAILRRVAWAVLFFLTAIGTVSAGRLDHLREAFVEVSMLSYAPEGEATENFIRYSDYGRANDVLLLQLYMSVHLPDAEVERLLGLFDGKGCWVDIDYDDNTKGRWQPSLHLTRMYALAKLYANTSSPWHGEERIGGLLHKGLEYFYVKKPRSLNWWHGEIGVPKKLAAILLLIRDELSARELTEGLEIIARSKFGRTGQNRVWLAGNNLMRGLLTDDPALVARACDEIADEIAITESEGVQEDWSFHQHGPQIQIGNYGLTYAEVISFWLRVLDGTPYMFSEQHCSIIENLMKEGIYRSVWKGSMDPSFCGRQVFMNGGRGKACAVAVTAKNIAALKRPGYEAFEQMAGSILARDNNYGEWCGARYYYRSDCGIYRTATWYSSIRMYSERTIGFEFTNRENTLADFSANGALLFAQHGSEYENIFAHWDWRMVPGTTAYDDGQPLKSNDSVEAKKNRSAHVGGITLDDKMMCTTMEIERDGLHALKSAFFFEDLVVALGADIRTSNPEIFRITTALDQTHFAGDVTLSEERNSLPWIHHDDRSYVSLDGTPLALSTDVQRGEWEAIDPTGEGKTQEGRVFKCYFEHDPAGTSRYAYAILPYRDVKQTEKFAKHPDVKVFRNDAKCQAVGRGNTLYAVIHQTGVYKLGNRTIRAKEPALYIFDKGNQKISPLPRLTQH